MGDRLRPLWDFDDLDGSERRLQAQLLLETTGDGRAEVLTQLARAQGLRDNFAAGEELVVEAEQLTEGGPSARSRIQMERGRLLLSSEEAERARPLFESAFNIANDAGEEFLAADAAHMSAIAAPDRAGKLAWTDRGIGIARASIDRQVSYWLGPLYNNLGWEYQDSGEYEAALDSFKRALEVRERYPEMPALIQHAKEAMAEALRALGRQDEANRLLGADLAR